MPPEPPTEPDADDGLKLSDLGRALFGDDSGSAATMPRRKPWQPPTADALHAMLPQYEVLRLIGRGGMGAVYRGRQVTLDRPVAIKILSAQLDEADIGFSKRFQNEARAMAKLEHPGIVKVYDFGETPDGLLYIVMEYIEGTDVQQMLHANARLHSEQAIAIAVSICDALAYAHGRGIVHRDIKPSNILCAFDGSVFIADFGLVKNLDPSQSAGLTRSGMTMGTPQYMAPESLIPGIAIDHRADIYAVGVMLYQMLTGKLPQGLFELPSLLVQGLDPRLDTIIAQAMREDRERRHQHITQLRDELDAIVTRPLPRLGAYMPVLNTEARPQRPSIVEDDEQAATILVPTQAKPRPRMGLLWATTAALGMAIAAWFAWPRAAPVELTKTTTVSTGTAAASPQLAPSFTNSLGMKFVSVPGTTFLICVHETRRADYAAFAAQTFGLANDWQALTYRGYTITERADEHPVVSVSWDDAVAFCEWLSKKEGRDYRLPTRAEWMRASGYEEYPWGFQWPPPKGAGNFADMSRKANGLRGYVDPSIGDYNDGFPGTAPVMSFTPNKAGIYDMAGNVMEWCAGVYLSRANDKGSREVSGGGCWLLSSPEALRTISIQVYPKGSRDSVLGFRCVCEPLASSQN